MKGISESNDTNWCHQSVQDLANHFKTDTETGLSNGDALRRLHLYGPNQLLEQAKISPLRLFFRQFSSFIIWVLIAAAFIAGMLSELVDALAISVIIILNALIGFFQEYKAEKSLAALRKMTSPTSKVIRDRRLKTLPASEIVPGDLVLIEAGDRIPADGRIVRSFGLSIQEAALTGESMPIHKVAEALVASDLTVADKKNMGFLGTVAVSGKGYMIVTETGAQTELGKIASLLEQGSEQQTPLQRRLQELGTTLVWVCLGIVSLVFAFGYLKRIPLMDNLLISISIAVAAIPEGLPAIVTIALSIGVHKMASRNALVRRLPSIETLGCTTVICTDKTGTLTQNEMVVRSIWVNHQFFDVSGIGCRPEGNFEVNHIPIDLKDIPELTTALKIGVLCNGAELHQSNDPLQSWGIAGDPTEGALLVAAGKANLFKQKLEDQYPLFSEIPFDSERKRMSMVRQTPDGLMLFIKGAPDVLLEHSKFIVLNGNEQPLTEELKREILEANAYLASQALRVLAVGYRPLHFGATIDHTIENKLIFVGLIAMIDPPKSEVKASIASCDKAGIKTIMITGDNKETAVAIGKELNLLKGDSIVLTGVELEQMSESRLRECVRNIAIYARTSAAHKLRIVRAWKAVGEVVAMTGDGVNDAPALKEADIGVAMGITGTEVTKEASDMVISDDNFASIVNAVEEGRGIYDNITKFVCYLISSNFAELIVVFVGMLVGFTDFAGNSFVPLAAVQILWINLASDGLPAIALGVDPIDPKAMERPPRKKSDSIIPMKKMLYLIFVSCIIAVGTLFACYFGMHQSGTLAQTMAFTTIVILELLAVQIIRAPYNLSFFSNPYILVAVVISFLLQLLIIYTPFLQNIFNTTSLGVREWGGITLITISVWILTCLSNRLFNWRLI